MEELKELAYILNKYQPRSIQIIGHDAWQSDSKLSQLYEVIQNDEVTSDRDAAHLIYGEEENSSKYRNLKHELKKRLLNTIFFIDNNEDKKRDKAYYQSWKDWAACQILIEKSARQTAVSLAEKTLKRCLKYDFLSLVSSIALLLRNHYALREKNKKRFEYYDNLYENSRRQEEYNNLAHKYYMKLILDYTMDSVTANPQIEADAQVYYQELAHLKKETNNIKFHYYLYQIQLLGKMGVFNYQAAKDICTDAIAFLRSQDVAFKGGMRNFLLNKLVCHIQLREFEEGKQAAIACNKLVANGTFNWFKTNEYFFILSFHTGNYQEAYDDYFKIVNHPRYKTYKILHETWALYRMYLHFLYLLGKFEPATNDNSFNNIRLGKFINAVPSFAKDKRGMNIPVLIIQMAFLILQHKYDSATERIDALNKYCDRYLKTNDPNFRCNCFIKMLVQIPKSHFHRSGVERKAEPYLRKIQRIAINFNNQAHELEILPFEHLWEHILGALENKFFRPKSSRSEKNG
ncbi:hypothetical protein [Lewinella sp. LCG006]|uniref:hypothetical protein n=1 Tax=Lewinella sp. LCG006 TaxID=3231911 RepID=UPI003460FE9F